MIQKLEHGNRIYQTYANEQRETGRTLATYAFLLASVVCEAV